jgi:hypothetical protein
VQAEFKSDYANASHSLGLFVHYICVMPFPMVKIILCKKLLIEITSYRNKNNEKIQKKTLFPGIETGSRDTQEYLEV